VNAEHCEVSVSKLHACILATEEWNELSKSTSCWVLHNSCRKFVV